MTACRHEHLILMPEAEKRLRCRYCHLTIKAEELHDGCCPECFESTGKKRDEFDIIESSAATRYRCEDCGTIIEYDVADR